MTDEEINRKFDVVANHLASLAVGLQGLQDEVRGLAEMQRRAEERWINTEEGVRALLAISEIQAQEIKDLSESVKVINERTGQTEDNLNALINTVERFVSERRKEEEEEE